MYSRIVPATSMLARPLVSPAALPQPALGDEAPAPPLLLGAPAPPNAPPPPTAGTLPALLPDPAAALAFVPPALTCPPTPGEVPPDPGAPPFCSLDVAPATVEPPLLLTDPPVPPLPLGPKLSEPEQAIAQGRNATVRLHARKVGEWPGCMIFFSLAGSMNSGPEAVAPSNPMQRQTVSTRAAAAERAILPSPVGSKFPLRLRTEPARARGRALRSGFPCYSASGWRFGAASRKAVSKAQFSSMASSRG